MAPNGDLFVAETQDALARANANGTVLGDFWVHRIDAAATPVLLIVNDLQAAGVVTLWLLCAKSRHSDIATLRTFGTIAQVPIIY